MRGKYAARAANREVARDNELITEKMRQLDELNATIETLKAELAHERAERSNLVVRRTKEMIAREVAIPLAEIEELKRHHKAQMRKVADLLGSTFKRRSGAPRNYFTEIVPLLIPEPKEQSEYIDRWLNDNE